jgi:signal transduction histidine kinase
MAITSNGRIGWANAPWTDLFGKRDLRELLGVSIDSLLDDAEVVPPPPGAVDAVVSSLRTAEGSRTVEIVRLGERRRRAGARPATPESRGAVPAPADSDRCEAGEELWVIRDVAPSTNSGAQLYEMSRALYDSNRELEALREQLALEILEREQLLSVVSHELRTPITVIRGYNNLLLSAGVGELNEQQQSFLRESNRSCERLNRFVGDLLVACGEAGSALSIERTSASLEPLVSGLVTFLRPLLEQHDLQLSVDLAPDALLAEFDPVRIEQVITNLLINAIRFSKPGSTIQVRSRRTTTEGGEEEIEVSVVDTGPGVALENRERIFEPYVRAGDDRTPGGLGLGLAICKRIVDAHGGTIEVDDEPGAGSRFAFSLPLRAGVG